jgi:hypothetical protein
MKTTKVNMHLETYHDVTDRSRHYVKSVNGKPKAGCVPTRA